MKKIILVGLFTLVLIGLLIVLMPSGESVNNPNIWFYDQSASKGSEIFVDNISFPNNMTSAAYADDLVTPRTILNTYRTRIQWVTSIGTWYNLSYPLSPMDSGAFNSTQFYFYAKWTGKPTSVTLKFEITLLNNNSKFNRSVTITANATYYILTGLEMCKACTRYTCTAVTSGFTGLRVMVNQSRWGVIAKYDKTYYVKNAQFTFYSGYGVTDKTISINDNIVFNLSSTFDDYPFLVSGQNHLDWDNMSYIEKFYNTWFKGGWMNVDNPLAQGLGMVIQGLNSVWSFFGMLFNFLTFGIVSFGSMGFPALPVYVAWIPFLMVLPVWILILFWIAPLFIELMKAIADAVTPLT
jgi:hypothetical protein